MNSYKIVLVIVFISFFLSKVDGQTKKKEYLIGGNFSLKDYALKLDGNDNSKTLSGDFSIDVKPWLFFY